MERIVVEVNDETKARLLVELLNSLDFVESATILPKKHARKRVKASDDFFALAGIWADRTVSIDSIRRK